MEKEIINRVANSALMQIDLEEYYPNNQRVSLDLKNFLSDGILLKEKEFRAQLNAFDFTVFQDKFVAIDCSVEAILPSWTYFLLTSYLQPYAKLIVHGNLQDLEREIFIYTISAINWEQYRNKKVIVKGCSKKQIPQSAFVFLLQQLQPLAQSILFGEACSSVPVFKAK